MRRIFLFIFILSITTLTPGCGEPDSETAVAAPPAAGEDSRDRLLEERLESERNLRVRAESRLEERLQAENRAVKARDAWATATLLAAAAAVVLFIAGVLMGSSTSREAENDNRTQNRRP